MLMMKMMMNVRSRFTETILVFLGIGITFPVAGAEYSRLWGRSGEAWSPDGRLPDFSFAGYGHGDRKIPGIPVVANVRDFGARGDGTHDDTEAFEAAIRQTDHGAILIPAGRYRITKILYLRKGNLVLRGEGPRQTTLVFPKTLNAIKPNWGATTSGRRTSNYSWSGGFIWVEGDFQSEELTGITRPARRGDRAIEVASPTRLHPGDWIEIRQRDTPDNSLARSLYAGQPGPMGELRGRTRTSLTARIVSIHGSTVTLNRSMRSHLELRWHPRVLRFAPTVTEVGIEQLGFEFPATPYAGHFTELGHNALTFREVADCWARDLHIQNAEGGIFASCRFTTLSDIVLASDRRPDDDRRSVGHHGVSLGGNDNLFTRFDFRVRYIHDITVSHCTGNVCSAGRGVDLCFDHHKRAPYANLFTDIDLGVGSRMYQCGGGAELGKNAAARTTFWNIRAEQPQSWPPARFGPDLMNLVGVYSQADSILEPEGKWFEVIAPGAMVPANLHEAQRMARSRREHAQAPRHDLKPRRKVAANLTVELERDPLAAPQPHRIGLKIPPVQKLPEAP